MEILEVLKDIELTDQQTTALDKFFEEFKTKITNDVAKQYSEGIDTEKYVLREDAEKAFALFESDCEKAFDLFEDDADKAFGLFEEDAEAAFNLGVEDVQKIYTENMTVALQEVYDEVSERVKKDFLESKEYRTIQKLKDLIIPLLEDTDNDLVEKIKAISDEKEQILEENKKLSKTTMITTLLKDIPSEYVETVEEFISLGKDEDEVIERFNSIVEMMEKQFTSKKEEIDEMRFARKTKPTQKPITEDTKPKEEQTEDGMPVFRSILEEAESKEAKIPAFDDKFNAIINKVFA